VLVLGLCAGMATVAWASQGGAGGQGALAADPAPAAGQPAKARQMAPPVYPKAAFEQGISGRVVLWVEVRADGTPGDIRVLSSQPAGVFDEVSVAAARQWTFDPAQRDGKAVAAALKIPLTFAMNEPEPAS